MRKIISSTMAVLALTVGALVSAGSPASAAPTCEGLSVRTGTGEQGALALCATGEGDIRVVVRCLTEANFKKYTKFGVWRHDSPTIVTHSIAYCSGADAMLSHSYQIA